MNIKHCFNYVKKPIYNGKVERFNRTFQEALCYDYDFLYDLAYDIESAQKEIDKYLVFYNNERPHSSINFLTPKECVLQFLKRDTAVQKVLN